MDKFYFNEKKYFQKPKHTSIILKKLISKLYSVKDKKVFLDVGCANGSLIFYIKKNLKILNLLGQTLTIVLKNILTRKK